MTGIFANSSDCAEKLQLCGPCNPDYSYRFFTAKLKWFLYFFYLLRENVRQA